MNDSVKLAPAGAGLPLVEQFMARILFGAKRSMGSPDSFKNVFQEEQTRIVQLVDRCPAEHRSSAVLIRRLPGLEDSSRNWSVWMTLDHLHITNRGMAGIIESLLQDQQPSVMVRTADMKPSQDIGSEVLAEFTKSSETLLRAAGDHESLHTSKRHAHPWFGLLDGHGWMAMASMHMGIHRRQIEAILAGIGSGQFRC